MIEKDSNGGETMGKSFKEKTYDMRVRSISKIERVKEDSDSTIYKLVARDKEGINEITITSASPFTGLSPRDGVVQVVLQNSQLSIDDFKEPEEEKEEEEKE